ncbi:molybdopterin dehydrogenase [Aureimonas endophytica]|uniref:Molybdopterin dehydrogenase n=1 Tax=Aureimonas endophytica TaxID=2027858 RepID=A0A916ZR86_9HYPH|nr:FAD binding domain-containing protein [Aureimonas endophytica]GGE07532.1 molybdopterin dehydrogenase [Aureimonas endophytica]
MAAPLAAPPSLHVAATLREALDALAERGPEGAPFAGGTWIMRAPLRHEAPRPAYVALGRIAELREIAVGETELTIGAAVTHAALAEALAGLPEFAGLRLAAGTSANPAVRAAATLGGNLATAAFPAADLVPALLALSAEVEIADRQGAERLPIAEFLARRASLAPGRLLTRVRVPRRHIRSAHARLPLRKAGDYPVAVVALAIEPDGAGRIGAARIAVGSVEPVARRWDGLEAALRGSPLDPAAAAERARAHADEFSGRDGIEAPGWYRVSVLPALVRRAVAALGPR